MKFYLTLKECYKKGMTPFELYSIMSDLCGSDLKLKREIDYLYASYKQRDIFEQISRCSKDEFDLLLKEYDKKFVGVVISVANLLHPEWKMECKSESIEDKRVKANKVISNNLTSRSVPLIKQSMPKAQKIVNAKQKALNVKRQRNMFYATQKSISINSFLSNVEITTRAGVVDFEIRTFQNCKWTVVNKGILKRRDYVYINIEKIIADKIEIIIPKDKYKEIKVDKIHGNLTITDNNDCFGGVIVNLNSGNLKSYVSSEITMINVVAGEVLVEYNSIITGKVDIRNGIGGVKLFLHNVKKAIFNLMSMLGQEINRFKPGKLNGKDLEVNIKSKYGDIEVF